jgi:hypothetical protein
VPPIAALETVPIVAALILAVLVFSGWVYAMIRIDPLDDPLAHERAGQVSSEASAAGEREWLKVPPVRPGGVCQIPGSVGSTATGVAMICTPERDGAARWRWRQPARRSA